MSLPFRKFWQASRTLAGKVNVHTTAHHSFTSVVMGDRRPPASATCKKSHHLQTVSFPSQRGRGERSFPPPRVLLLSGFLGLLKEDKESETGEDRIVHLIKLAKLSQERQDFKKSEQLLHVALKMAQDIQHRQAQQYIINEMANNAHSMGDYHKAERLLKETVKNLIANGLPQDDNTLIHVSIKLANVYTDLDKHLEAEVGYKFCVDKLEEKIEKGADDSDTLAVYCLALASFGEFRLGRGALTGALDLSRKAHEISTQLNGASHPYSLQLLNSMAAANTQLNRFDEAIECLLTAIRLAKGRGLEGDGANDLPYYYINLANVYLTKFSASQGANASELLDKAKEACQDAIRVARNLKNPDALAEGEKCMQTIKTEIG